VAVERDWLNLRFVPEHMKSQNLCETAMKQSVHAQRSVPERFRTPEMYLHCVKADGMALEHVPENCRTPEVCFQAVLSSPSAKDFVPKRFDWPLNIYGFYDKLKDEFLLAGQLSFEQVQKVFNGEKVRISGVKFAKNAALRDFTLDFDRKTGDINIKTVEKKPENRQNHHAGKPEKRKGMKM
jgi:hypothetical protein